MQLRFEEVDKRFGQLEVINGFSGEFAQGELVALVGASVVSSPRVNWWLWLDLRGAASRPCCI